MEGHSIEHTLFALSFSVLTHPAETVLAIVQPPRVRQEEQQILAETEQQLERFGERQRLVRLSKHSIHKGRQGRFMAQTAEKNAGDRGAAAPHLFELKNVGVFYGAAQALNQVLLRVDEGEIVCLLGGNASGKSTTMKLIRGLLRPRSGEVLLQGQSTARLATPEIIKLGVASVLEARRVFPEMTVEENLRMGAYLRRGNAAIKTGFAAHV